MSPTDWRELPLADLHRHLDGSLRPSTVEDLAGQTGHTVPDPLAFAPGMGLDAALSMFGFTLSLLQAPEAVRRVAAEMCEDAAADNVSTLEIRFAPQLHRGADPATIVDAAIAGARGRAGLILCGLYGEAPEVLEGLVEIAASRPAVVGIDLAGAPLPEHEWRMADYAGAYGRAADVGLGRTVHAGEGRPAEEIIVAIEALGAQRIGHGTTVLEDPEAVQLILDRGVTLEACPTSNVHTGVIEGVGAHPLAAWIDQGLRVCVCTDNTLFSQVTARQEHRNVAAITGMDDRAMRAVIDAGHAARFERRVAV